MESIPETTNYSDKILSLLWGQSGYQNKYVKASDTLSNDIDKVGLVKSCICMNRVGITMEHAGGMSVSDIRCNLINLFVTGSIPHNLSLANIIVSIQRPYSAVVFAKPFFIGVKYKGTLAVASSHHNIITRCDFVSPVNKVLKAFQECEESSIQLQVLRTFTAMAYPDPPNYHKSSNQAPSPNN